MNSTPKQLDTPGGRLVPNIMHFARVLRSAGLPVGPGRVLDALVAVERVGIQRQDDLYWTLHALFVNHPRQRELFDQAFHIFWRNPQLLEKMMSVIMPETRVPARDNPGEQLKQRLADALFPNQGEEQDVDQEYEEEEFRANLTWSDNERLLDMDFESMSTEEMHEARNVIKRMDLAATPIRTRRFIRSDRGQQVDLRATIRAGIRHPAQMPLVRRRQRTRAPVLVTLCDISGSMSQYSRMVLHFMHAVTSARDRVHSFVFGTRLTNITRHLRYRDVDIALERISDSVDDWSGGTRIGQCIEHFNKHWSRRVLGQGAIILLISDGLDRDAGDGLAVQMQRLSRSCRRLVWLNPLLRYEGYEPRTLGSQSMLPYVHDFRSIHNLNSMRDLAGVLSRPVVDSRDEVKAWQARLGE